MSIIGIVLASSFVAGPAGAATVAGVSYVTSKVVAIHVVDGHGVYPRAHEATPERIDEKPMDTARAGRPATWKVTSPDDPAYRAGRKPLRVGCKTKGRDVAILTPWKPVMTREHWVYLVLPAAMKPGKTYRIGHGGLLEGPDEVVLTYDPVRLHSEAVHANQVGYSPDSPRRWALVSAWLGDLGPLSLDEYRGSAFHVVGTATGTSAFDGQVSPRKTRDPGGKGVDSLQPGQESYWRADVLECDFTGLTAPGEYVLVVDGIGASFPFRIGRDAYRAAFASVMKGIYQQRCGTALEPAYTAWSRSLCHHPSIKPVIQSRRRYMEGHCDACKEVEATAEKRDIWGGYHDAGDWDREDGHPEVPAVLAFAYELAPDRFRDGEGNIPESGNGVPDILDEARWGLDYYRRVQRPDGGVSIGLFLDSFPDAGEGPAWDTGNWYCYESDPDASYKYAAAACHFASAMRKAGMAAAGTPYVESARRAWQWAEAHQRPGDAAKVRDARLWAAAALFRETGAAEYHEAFRKDLKVATPETPLTIWGIHHQEWPCWVYALTDRPEVDRELHERVVKAVVHFAREAWVKTAARRTSRMGGDLWRPLWWGFGSVPDTMVPAVAWKLTGEREFLDVMHTGCDAMLGVNPLSMCWITGTGSRSPEMIFHPDSWYSPKGPVVAPGIVPEGPHAFDAKAAPGNGPWDPKWVLSFFRPPAKEWPTLELYAEARTCYAMNEFTVRQLAAAAAAYGLLCAPAK